MKAIYLPRTLAGTISETIACATGASPPTPTPMRKRQTIKAERLQAAAAARLAKPPDQHRHLEDRLAAVFVGRRAEQNVADELAGEGHRRELAGLSRREVEGHDEGAEQEREKRDVDLVDEPGGGDDREDLALVAGHRQALEAAGDVRDFEVHDHRRQWPVGDNIHKSLLSRSTTNELSMARRSCPSTNPTSYDGEDLSV